ncbi:Integrase, catalytic region (fragment) [Parafrankia sp. Ea1.12]
MVTHLRTELITDAFTTATSRTTLTQNAIFHSDRGAQTEFNRSSQHRPVGVRVAGCSSLRWGSSSGGSCGAGR